MCVCVVRVEDGVLAALIINEPLFILNVSICTRAAFGALHPCNAREHHILLYFNVFHELNVIFARQSTFLCVMVFLDFPVYCTPLNILK